MIRNMPLLRAIAIAPVLTAVCVVAPRQFASAHDVKPIPEPKVTYTTASTGDSLVTATGERTIVPDEARKKLHAQHHGHQVLQTRNIPGKFEKPAMKSVHDFALRQDELVVINPGPGEYVSVMEGQRHGYQNLTVGITYTSPGGAPPMHTHMGEESHVLLDGTILYALGDSVFVMKAPYIVNIPPMVPHCFMNLGEEVAQLVVIFPTNVWEYDVLDHFPFKGIDMEKAKQGSIVK